MNPDAPTDAGAPETMDVRARLRDELSVDHGAPGLQPLPGLAHRLIRGGQVLVFPRTDLDAVRVLEQHAR